MSKRHAWMIAIAIALAPALGRATVAQPAQASGEQEALEAAAFGADLGLSVLNAYTIPGDGSYLLGTAGLVIGTTSAIWAGTREVRTDVGKAVMVTGTVASLTGAFAILRALQTRDAQTPPPVETRSVIPHVGVGKVGKGAGVVLRWRW